MQLSHVLSDAVLCLIAFFVFFHFLIKLRFSETILWEAFVLSVAMAAFFGCFRFAGFDNALFPSRFFQNMASFVGSMGLIVAVFVTVNGLSITKKEAIVVLFVGFVLFALAEIFKVNILYKYTPIFAMLLILAFGFLAIYKEKNKMGILIILGVCCFAIASIRESIFSPGDYLIDVYHYLTAAGLLLLGQTTALKKTVK